MIILTYITHGYKHWFHHLRLNLKLLDLDSCLHVCTSSSIRLFFENVTVLNHNFSTKAETFGSKDYGAIVNGKHDCIMKFYRRYDILFLDTDVTLFRSPIPYLKQHDIGVPLFMDDSGPLHRRIILNSGCIYLPRTDASIDFMDTFMQHLQREKRRNDQDVLNKHKPRTYGILQKNLFANGYSFYEDRHKHALDRELILVHHNWIAGDARKWQRAISFDCILNQTSRLWFSSMLERSVKKPPWIYQKE